MDKKIQCHSHRNGAEATWDRWLGMTPIKCMGGTASGQSGAASQILFPLTVIIAGYRRLSIREMRGESRGGEGESCGNLACFFMHACTSPEQPGHACMSPEFSVSPCGAQHAQRAEFQVTIVSLHASGLQELADHKPCSVSCSASYYTLTAEHAPRAPAG